MHVQEWILYINFGAMFLFHCRLEIPASPHKKVLTDWENDPEQSHDADLLMKNTDIV